MTSRIPITILSGYLGAGKTTIINRVLAGDHGRRVAVLVNDFGAVNIDARLIETAEEDKISLTNGCVCCSLGDDLGGALDAQAARAYPPEHILLEASGVAEPKRIAMHVGYWPGFERDALIVAVDAETVQSRVNDKFVGQLVRSQIRTAEIIALTKTDLCGAVRAAEVIAFLRQMVPDARIVETPGGALAVDLAFGAGGQGEPGNGFAGSADAAHTHLHTQTWVPDGPLSAAALALALGAMPTTVHRVKGFFHDADTGRATLVQCVGTRFEFSATAANTDPALVLIGVGSAADTTDAMDRLKACAR